MAGDVTSRYDMLIPHRLRFPTNRSVGLWSAERLRAAKLMRFVKFCFRDCCPDRFSRTLCIHHTGFVCTCQDIDVAKHLIQEDRSSNI
jgi:hypothetical protein